MSEMRKNYKDRGSSKQRRVGAGWSGCQSIGPEKKRVWNSLNRWEWLILLRRTMKEEMSNEKGVLYEALLSTAAQPATYSSLSCERNPG